VKIKTERLGTLSRSKLAKLIKEAGDQKRLAVSLGIPESTVRNWNLRLRRANA